MFQLLLDTVHLNVKLGYSDAERSVQQGVFLQIKFRFETTPSVCMTDDLQDTICYATLIYKLQAFCDGRSFKLIESLAYQLFQFVKAEMTVKYAEKVALFLQITKNPPLSSLEKASFSISD